MTVHRLVVHNMIKYYDLIKNLQSDQVLKSNRTLQYDKFLRYK